MIINDVPGPASASEILFFKDENGKFCGSVPDLVWREWKLGNLSNQIGNHEVILTLPTGWMQIVDNKVAKVSEIKVSYQVAGYIVAYPGEVESYNLVNAEDNRIEKSQTTAKFSPPAGTYPTNVFRTEEDLDSFTKDAKGIIIFVGRFRLPRVVFYSIYWPPSKKSIQLLIDRLVDALDRGENFDINSTTLSEIEGDDLAAIWEPIIEDHPMLKTKKKENVEIEVTEKNSKI